MLKKLNLELFFTTTINVIIENKKNAISKGRKYSLIKYDTIVIDVYRILKQ